MADLVTGETTCAWDVPPDEGRRPLADLSWSPTANVLAIVREDAGDTDVAFYDVGQGRITVRTSRIAGVKAMRPFTAWAADGGAFFVAAGQACLSEPRPSYRVDPATGDFTPIYTCAENQCIRSLNITPWRASGGMGGTQGVVFGRDP